MDRSGACCIFPAGSLGKACLPTSTPVRHKQCAEPQDHADLQLVRQAATLASPLHADLGVLDQPGGTVLRPFTERPIKRGAHRPGKINRCHHRLHRCAQRRPQALPLNNDCRRHPRIHCLLLPPHPQRPGQACMGSSKSGRKPAHARAAAANNRAARRLAVNAGSIRVPSSEKATP